MSKIVSEYDQEIPQSQIADNPVAPRGRANLQRAITQKNKISLSTHYALLADQV